VSYTLCSLDPPPQNATVFQRFLWNLRVVCNMYFRRHFIVYKRQKKTTNSAGSLSVVFRLTRFDQGITAVRKYPERGSWDLG
jgi:hypothetical protein